MSGAEVIRRRQGKLLEDEDELRTPTTSVSENRSECRAWYNGPCVPSPMQVRRRSLVTKTNVPDD